VLGAVVGLVVLVAVPYVFLGGIVVRDATTEYLGRESFDSAAWQDHDHVVDAVRIRMVDDLLDRHDFRSKTRGEIVTLLGEPDETEYLRDWDMVYWLGPERGFMSIDSEWLVLRLNADSVVTECELTRD